MNAPTWDHGNIGQKDTDMAADEFEALGKACAMAAARIRNWASRP